MMKKSDTCWVGLVRPSLTTAFTQHACSSCRCCRPYLLGQLSKCWLVLMPHIGTVLFLLLRLWYCLKPWLSVLPQAVA